MFRIVIGTITGLLVTGGYHLGEFIYDSDGRIIGSILGGTMSVSMLKSLYPSQRRVKRPNQSTN